MPPTSSARAELVPLTTMRGIAASFVVVYHLHFRTSEAWPSRCYLWVDLFFVLSGFVLAHVYGAQMAQRIDLRTYRDFLAKRFARIYPLHFVMLAVVVALVFGLGVSYFRSSTPSLFANLALVHAWGIEHALTWNVVSWSISCEWAFYLVFPLLAMLLVRQKPVVSMIGIALMIVGLAGLEWTSGSLNLTFDLAVPRCLLDASSGILLYNLYRTPGSWHRIVRLDVVRWPLLVVPLVLMQYSYDTAVIAAFAPLLLAVALADGAFARFLTLRPLHHIGEVSYSLYMCHWVIAYFALRGLYRIGLDPKNLDLPLYKVVAVNVAMIVVCVGVATALYRLVEMPGRAWLQRVLLRR